MEEKLQNEQQRASLSEKIAKDRGLEADKAKRMLADENRCVLLTSRLQCSLPILILKQVPQ